ncbi:sensor domain-containing diguanylate cyclase [Zavarzinia aquatilis]|uniref:diguanylate cyclase n=1 Tax=Zavarzinia aquatilis TaxID=2211142 RepID=A0A317EBS2_9PROT|nr:diguanylate cyclase [Zavarzinia aquatilis]PWR22625.1 GGDEF domain-containing protein [Zavarzinia aquatilis]
MPGRDILLAEGAAPRHLWVIGTAALLLALTATLAFIDADRPLPEMPAFLPAYGMAVIVINLQTGFIILTHVPFARRRYLLVMGLAYLYVAAIATAQMLVFPGVLAPHGLLGAGPQSAIWLWVLWHGGFPGLILAAMILGWCDRRRERVVTLGTWHNVAASGGIFVVVGILLWLVTGGQTMLPPIIADGGSFADLWYRPSGIAVLLLNGAALIAVVFVMRGRTMIGLGLGLAMLASLSDSLLTLHSGARYTLGWYAARGLSILSALSVLAVYFRELTRLHARIIRLNARLETQATVDELTGLYNRRHFNRQLDAVLRLARRRGGETALLLIDVDHFKRFNDRHGHQQGDECLRQIGAAIQSIARRPGDVAARYGGEEFAVILPDTSAEGTIAAARRLLDATRGLAIVHEDSPAGGIVTVSIGVAGGGPDATPDSLIRAADGALYAAKAAGRDRLEVAAAAL